MANKGGGEPDDMELNCKNCGAMCGHWLVVETGGREAGAPPRYKCVCLKCQSVWQMEHHPLQAEKRTMHNATACAVATGAEMVETFGVKPPPDDYYLHQGHAWALLEEDGQVRVGLDDFSQKILGPADEVRLPAVGAAYYQDHLCLALVKDGKKAAFEAPVDGVVTEVNAKVVQKPRLVHDDPYGAGWLFKVKPTNLQHNLDNLSSGRQNAAWLGKESHRLLHLVETAVGATLPDGGGLVDDVFSHFPGLGWRRLVKEFFLTNVTRHWKKRV